MTKFKPIPEQEEIMKSQGESLVVCASAGSGKTSVMVRKITSLIIDSHIDVSDVLVLTYTNAAATEMKERLKKSLSEKGTDYALMQLDEVASADISTVHSFCDRLIKKYGHFCGLDINLNLLSESMQIYYKRKAFKSALYKLDKESFLKLMSYYRRMEDSIADIIFGIESYKNSSLNLEIMNGKTNEKLAEDILNKNLIGGIKHFVSVFESVQKRAKVDSHIALVNKITSAIGCVSDKFDFATNYGNLIEIELPVMNRDGDKDPEVHEFLKTTKAELSKFIKNQKDKELGSKDIIEKARGCGLQKIFFDLFALYEKEYLLEKQKALALDFDDLEQGVLKILEVPEALEEIRDTYKYVFVDEYQDANRVQEKIVKTIAGDGNLFVVGDPKQGIYGFRQSCPDIILEDFNSGKFTSKMLKSNFRSDKKVLDFVNEVFSVVMTEETAKIDYKKTSMLSGMADYPDDEDIKVNIDVVYTPKESKEEAQGVYDISEDVGESYSEAAAEAVVCASRIAEAMSQKIYDKDLNITRSVRYSDITVLLRSRGDYIEEFSNKLSSLGVPVISDAREDLLSDPYVKQVFNYLKLSNFLYDDFTLAGVMLSLFGGFSASELLSIRGEFEGSFYETVLGDKSDKVSKFLCELEDFRKLVALKGAFITASELLERKRFFAGVLSTEGGGLAVSKVKLFLNSIESSGHNFSLSALVDYYENGKEKSFTSHSAASDAVNISTIHGSKGLEYPIVILANAGKNLRGPDMAEFKIDNELGLALKYYDEDTLQKYNTVLYEAIKVKHKEEETSEELRVLYVALTRAKNKLYIIGSTKEKSFEPFRTDYEIVKTSNYLELILRALASDGKTCKIAFHEKVNVTEKKSKIVSLSYKRNEEQIEKIKNYLDYNYPYDDATKSAYKTSVTKLISKDKKINVREEKVESTNDGIAYHNLLKFLDFDYVEDLTDLNNSILALETSGKIDKKDIDFIDKNNLLKNIKIIKQLINGGKVLKEQQFIMKDHLDGEEFLVQGVVDLLVLGDKNILLDYKYTSVKNTEKLKNIYEKQIKIYEKAVKEAFNIENLEKYILSLKENILIKY